MLVLTTFDLDEYVLEALRAGASGFLLKTTPAAALVSAVRACAAGEMLLAPERHPAAGRDLRAAPPAARRRRAAAPRASSPSGSWRCCGRWRGGLSNAEIGRDLFLAETTVKTHVTHILAKLGLRDRVQAVIARLRDGAGPAGRAELVHGHTVPRGPHGVSRRGTHDAWGCGAGA